MEVVGIWIGLVIVVSMNAVDGIVLVEDVVGSLDNIK